MRRKDREMNREFALMVLDKCEYAVLATINQDGTPYCVPLTIVRKEDCIYFHCAQEGKKVQNLQRNTSVCLTAVGDTHILPHEFSTEYESAVVFGAALEVLEDAEKVEALRLLCQRHVPGNMAAFDAEIARSLSHTAVWKIQIETITGKRKKYDSHGKEMKFGRMQD